MIEYPIREHSVVEFDLDSGEHVVAVKFNTEPFKDSVFSISSVKFGGTEENPVLNFKYVMHAGERSHELSNEIGDLIMGITYKQIQDGNLVLGSEQSSKLSDEIDDIEYKQNQIGSGVLGG